MKTTKTYLAIDPGSAHVGWAMLCVSERRLALDCGVLDATQRDSVTLVKSLTPVIPGIVACESYQQRPVGHQRFANGQTLRLLGALEFHARSLGHQWREVPPGRPEELNDLGLAYVLDSWKVRGWPLMGNARWQHALSAWRVLAHVLLSDDVGLLYRIRCLRHPPTIEPSRVDSTYDLIADHALWRLP